MDLTLPFPFPSLPFPFLQTQVLALTEFYHASSTLSHSLARSAPARMFVSFPLTLQSGPIPDQRMKSSC